MARSRSLGLAVLAVLAVATAPLTLIVAAAAATAMLVAVAIADTVRESDRIRPPVSLRRDRQGATYSREASSRTNRIE